MNCKTAQRQMALAVGEDLSPSESQELRGHVQACSKCQQTWEQQRHGFAVLQRSRTQEIQPKSDSVWPVLANRLRERVADVPRSEFNGWIAALAVTAACVLVFVFSQDNLAPIAYQPNSGGSIDSTMVSSPADFRESTSRRAREDEVRTKPNYNPVHLP